MKKSNSKTDVTNISDDALIQEVSAAESTERISAEEVNEIMAKYDRESAVRVFSGNKALFVKLLLVAFTIFAVATNTVIRLNAQVHRTTFIAIVLFLAYLLYPAKKNAPKNTNKVPLLDIILAFASAGSFLYMGINYSKLVAQAGNYTQIDVIIAMIAIVLLFEACRRVVGVPILVVVCLFIAYAYFGNMIPGTFGHRGFTLQRIATHLYFTTEGIIGTPLAVCSTFIFLFILFGAFLERTGVGQFFIDIAANLHDTFSNQLDIFFLIFTLNPEGLQLLHHLVITVFHMHQIKRNSKQ